jgi:hypothetical protein
VRLRAAQATLFLARVLVRIPAGPILAAAAGAPAPLDRYAATLLRESASPELAAAGTLALASCEPAHRLCHLNIDSLASGCDEITVDSRAVPVPFYARSLLRAQRITRTTEGAQPSDPLFRDRRDPAKRAPGSTLQAALIRVANATGLALDTGSMYDGGTARFRLEDHVSIEMLPPNLAP